MADDVRGMPKRPPRREGSPISEDIRGRLQRPPRREGSRLPFGPTSARRAAQFRIKVRERAGFEDLRMENVDKHGHVQSVMGYRDGRWHTVTLLVDKNAAHVENGRLVADMDEAEWALDSIGGAPRQVTNDHFVAPGVPPTRPAPVIGEEETEPLDDRVQRVI